MRTLLIVPDSGLPNARSESDRVTNALTPTVISDEVSLARLSRIRESYDLIWFIAHGSESGVALDDQIYSKSGIASLVRRTNAAAVVLNTCESAAVAIALHDALSVDVVATIAEVDDAQALVTGVDFAEALAEGYSIYDAFALARPLHNDRYILLTAGDRDPYMTRPGRQDDDLALLVQAVLGNERAGVKGLIKDFASMEARIARIEESLLGADRRSLGRIEQVVLALFSGLVTAIGIGALWLSRF